MTKRTRVFLMVAVGILVLGLGTGLVASYMGLQGLAVIGGNGPEELAYVPADAHFVAFADVRDVMDSELRRRLSALRPDTRRAEDDFKARTGIDVETDIDYVVAAASGPAPSSQGEQRAPLVLARGRFDAVRIEGLVREKGGQVQDYKGIRLLVSEQQNFGLAFAEPGLVAIGPADELKRAIDAKASGASVTGNAEMVRLIRENGDGDAWAVARFDRLPSAGLPAEFARQLPSINWLSAKGHIGAGLDGHLRVEARDEAAAQNLQDVLRGFMALARLQAGQQAQFAELINSLQLGGQGTTVSLSFSVPPEVIDALGALRAGRPPRPEPPPVPVGQPTL